MAKTEYFANNSGGGIGARQIILLIIVLAVAFLAIWWNFIKDPRDTSSPGIDRPSIVVDEPSPSTVPSPPPGPAIPVAATQPAAARNADAVTAVAPAPQPTTGRAQRLLSQARSALTAQDPLQARQHLSAAVAAGLPDADRQQAFDLANQTSDAWLFSKDVFPGDSYCQWYKVQSGDRLAGIGKKFGVPYQLLMRINQITDPRRLAAGQTIKVVRGPFHLVVNRSKFTLAVYREDILVRTYPVGLGAPARQTPTGLWISKAGKKQVNPPWTDPDTGKKYYSDDPRNPLGERWIGLEGLEGPAKGRTGFGIHGTIEPEEVGRAVSRGCIRLYNHDVEELYDLVSDGVTQVRVIDK